MLLIKSLKEKSKLYNDPFPHWEINDPLSKDSVNEICNAEIANPIQDNLEYDGTRAIDGVMESLEQVLPMVEKQKNTDVLSRRKTLKNFLI